MRKLILHSLIHYTNTLSVLRCFLCDNHDLSTVNFNAFSNPSSTTDQPDSTALVNQLACLKQQLKNKEDLIHDLKVCLARTEKDLKQMQKQQKTQPPISAEQLQVELSKILPMLTTNQLALMTKEKKRVNWTPGEISTGFAHSYLGKRGYNFSIHKLGIPQPSIRTLQKWGEKIKIEPGILEDCLTILKAMGDTFSEVERQVRIFSFFQ